MKYTYNFHPTEKAKNATYTYEELVQLTTIQLREICLEEKLVIGVAYKLDRNHIISIILKYRGAKLYTFINKAVPERLDYVAPKFGSYLNFVDANKSIYLPAKITIYKALNMTHQDNYVVEGSGLFDGNALLLDDKRDICAILNIKKVDGKFYILFNQDLLRNGIEALLYKNYSIGLLEEKGSKYLYKLYYEMENVRPGKFNCYVKTISELLVMDTNIADTSLVIDFGTSNSSAGAYLDEHHIPNNVKAELIKNGLKLNNINKVKFDNTTMRIPEKTEILPTNISVKDCSDPENIVYRFGYDSLKNARKHSYNNPQSTFYAIKKWINNYEKEEEIADENGNIASVPRKEIIRAYFKHIIEVAEQQHKCVYQNINITSPVKQKQQYLEMYKEVLHDYKIDTKTALDEGIAVLYNSISNQIERQKFEDGMEYQALIIDCGGGTTDLTSCKYFIEDNQITYKLNLATTYANGETNFGGNNLTYRIFQYLKIIFTRYYRKESLLNVETILDMDTSDIYRFVDSYSCSKIYEPLETQYLECESTIPTRFYEYKNSPSEDFMKVRSNFYFLWNLAEKIKVDFYQTVGVNQTIFHEKGLSTNITDKKVVAEESWRLNIYQNKSPIYRAVSNRNAEMVLTLRTDFPQLVITKDEINMLVKADIYNVIKKFLEPIYDLDQIQDFNFIKLTGQTCKIDIFRDALKEFIPGKVIESSKKEKTIQDFKLTCLEGAIKYQNSKRIGLIAPTITNQAPITPYKLIAYTHTNLMQRGRETDGAEVIMISSLQELNKSYGFVSRNIETEDIELILKNAEEQVIHRYVFLMDADDFKHSTYEETTRDYSDKILQDDIDSIIDDEIKIFTFAFEDKWGFYVLPIARRDGTLLMGERKYFPFENDEWEINFFDGKK